VLPGIAVVVVLYVLLLPFVFYGFVHLAAASRMSIAVVVLAPLGVLMGMPMPTGIRLLADRAPALVPWAWGVNGAASVLGSVGAIALAMMAGFNGTLLTGAPPALRAPVCVPRPPSGGRRCPLPPTATTSGRSLSSTRRSTPACGSSTPRTSTLAARARSATTSASWPARSRAGAE